MAIETRPFEDKYRKEAEELFLQKWKKAKASFPSFSELSFSPDSILREGSGNTFWEEEQMIGYLFSRPSPYKGEQGEEIYVSPLEANILPAHILPSLLPRKELFITRFLSEPPLGPGFVPNRIDAVLPLGKTAEKTVSDGLFLRELPLMEQEKTRPLKKALEQHFSSPPIFRYTSREESEAWFLDREKRVFVAEEDNRILGFFAITRKGRNELTRSFWSSCGLYVDPDTRGRGIGRRLVDHVAEVLHSEGETLLGTDYNTANLGAKAFWEKTFIPYAITCRVSWES